MIHVVDLGTRNRTTMRYLVLLRDGFSWKFRVMILIIQQNAMVDYYRILEFLRYPHNNDYPQS